jgi:hypothetical protein
MTSLRTKSKSDPGASRFAWNAAASPSRLRGGGPRGGPTLLGGPPRGLPKRVLYSSFPWCPSGPWCPSCPWQ